MSHPDKRYRSEEISPAEDAAPADTDDVRDVTDIMSSSGN